MTEDRKDILLEHLRARLIPAFESAEVWVAGTGTAIECVAVVLPPGLKPADLCVSRPVQGTRAQSCCFGFM
jgi:hypothetical protein